MTAPTPIPKGGKVLPPEPAAMIRWPDDFGRRFTIFVDVEEEFDWTAPFPDRAPSVTAVTALPAMHARFVDRGIGATYMVDYPIATDGRAIDILRGIAATPGSEIGTQLHSWVNPPRGERVTPASSFAGNLPRDLEAAKLDRLTDAIVAAFGTRPRAYRAGRYGLGANTFELLAARGYSLDTSMRARHSYAAQGGPDFTAIGSDAFRVGAGGDIVELPLTTVYTGALRAAGARLDPMLGALRYARGGFARSGLLSRVPLTPEGTPVAEALEAVRIAVGEGVRLLNLSFHSPSLVPGNTPYVRDDADLAEFHHWWDSVLGLFDRLGLRPASLEEILVAAG